MKKILLLLIMFIFIGCWDGPAKTRRGESYYPIKVCAIGGSDYTCVDYKAKYFNTKGDDLMIETLDGHIYRYNHAGWAWIITQK